MDCYFYTSANGEWQVVVCDLCFFFIISINGLIFIHFCKWRFWDIYIRKDACSLRSRLSLFWYPAISQFCDSIIRIAYHTAIYKYGYTIIHGCDGDGFSHPVTDHDATRTYRYRRISMSGHMAIRISGGIIAFPIRVCHGLDSDI